MGVWELGLDSSNRDSKFDSLDSSILWGLAFVSLDKLDEEDEEDVIPLML